MLARLYVEKACTSRREVIYCPVFRIKFARDRLLERTPGPINVPRVSFVLAGAIARNSVKRHVDVEKVFVKLRKIYYTS